MDIPADIRSNRSVVIISTRDKNPEWEKHAESIHKQFRRMGIDAVAYIHYLDFHAGPHIEFTFQNQLQTRKINYVFLTSIEHRKVKMSILPVIKGKMDFGKDSWYEEGPTVNDVILKMAVLLKRMDVENTNFLIPEFPEIVRDISIYSGKQYPTYPSRLVRGRLAVALIPKMDSTNFDSAEGINKVNRTIDKINNKIKSVFKSYPYEYGFVDESSDEEIFKQ
ncbi:MAG: hypothetical protein MI865_01705, partial [Proteobacteria bacterium]|nr:hypothetical protein [Pseudomonadota bacterium]